MRTKTSDDPSSAGTTASASAAASASAGSARPDSGADGDNSPSGRARKRIKSQSIFGDNTASSNANSILSNSLLGRTEGIHEHYKASQPFPHAQILDVFQPDFLLACKEEIKSQTKVNFKESDLFRVYQSIDFANLDPERALAMNLDTSKLPNVLRLRDLLYSQEWRSFVEKCAGLVPGTLIDKIDSACNCHAPGCHLLCHDDVIGTRKISYIIYLTEEDWDGPTEGGALELYGPQNDDSNNSNTASNKTSNSNIEESPPSSQPPKNTPKSTPVPVARAWPTFNSMAFFEVLPGRSFHAVQEVTGERPRLSLQGWYHAKDPPPQEELEKATLQQLKARNVATNESGDGEGEGQGGNATASKDESSSPEETFGEADRAYLKDYIQNEYLTEESMNEIQTKFENNSTIQFRNFLLQKWVPTIESNYKDERNGKNKSNEGKKPADKAAAADATDQDKDKDISDGIDAHYRKGTTPEWNVRGPAHKQRYLSFHPSTETNSNDTNNSNANANATGKLLHTVQKKVFESEAFLRYLQRVTSLDKPTGILGDDNSNIRRFRPGLDYTVAHYGLLMQRSVLDATMCFVRDTTEYDQAMWESGDIGGFECYIEADIDDEDDNDEMGNDEGNDEGNGDGENATEDPEHNGAAAAAAAAPRPSGAADEYNEEDDTELLSVSASNNTLSLVYRDPGTMRFVKYVSSNAPSSRYDICMEYDLPPDDDDDDDDDNKNETEKEMTEEDR